MRRIVPLALLAAALPLAALATVGTVKAAAEVLTREPAPRLVGIACDGARGPLYAAEESDFPRCAAIEPMAGRVVWSAVAEWSNGESDVVERGSLADCWQALAPYRGRADVESKFCERESA